MSSINILEAFNNAGAGKVKASAVRMAYDHTTGPNMQVLAFDGQANGEAFAVTSEPFIGNPMDKAREMAVRLAEVGSPPANPQ